MIRFMWVASYPRTVWLHHIYAGQWSSCFPFKLHRPGSSSLSYIMLFCPLTILVALCNYKWSKSYESVWLLLFCTVCAAKSWQYKFEHALLNTRTLPFHPAVVWPANLTPLVIFTNGWSLRLRLLPPVYVAFALGMHEIQRLMLVQPLFCSEWLSNWKGAGERDRAGWKGRKQFPRYKVLLSACSMANL